MKQRAATYYHFLLLVLIVSFFVAKISILTPKRPQQLKLTSRRSIGNFGDTELIAGERILISKNYKEIALK